MSKLIILRGNSDSKKHQLQKNFGRNTMLISQDGIRSDSVKEICESAMNC